MCHNIKNCNTTFSSKRPQRVLRKFTIAPKSIISNMCHPILKKPKIFWWPHDIPRWPFIFTCFSFPLKYSEEDITQKYISVNKWVMHSVDSFPCFSIIGQVFGTWSWLTGWSSALLYHSFIRLHYNNTTVMQVQVKYFSFVCFFHAFNPPKVRNRDAVW